MAQLCANSLNSAKKLGLPMDEAGVLLTLPKGFRPPPKFPRGKLLQVKEDGVRIKWMPAMRLLAWMVASGMVKPIYEDRNDFAVDATA
jgi:hypothetical protein